MSNLPNTERDAAANKWQRERNELMKHFPTLAELDAFNAGWNAAIAATPKEST